MGSGTHVAVFTDTYLPTVNGVSYTIETWARYWNREWGRMDVVFPRSNEYEPAPHEHPVRSLPFPFYEGYRMSAPWVPAAVRDADVVHLHSLAALGAAGSVLAHVLGVPLVASYHTPVNEYGEYVVGDSRLTRPFQRLLRRQERLALGLVDHVVVPSAHTKRYLEGTIRTDTSVTVVSNGVDLETFAPHPSPRFPWADDSRPVVGYTGRHGVEKELDQFLLATAAMDVDPLVVVGGDGPARDSLERLAAELPVDVRFPGFVPRDRLAELYSSLDVFAFPSPVETEGLVAREAIACGTPVVGVNAGALPETIRAGETGYRFQHGDVDAFAASLDRALADSDLERQCLAVRAEFDVRTSVAALERLYDGLGT